MTADDFVKTILPAFEQAGYKEELRKVMIVGLHTCGDLAPTLLRIFCSCSTIVGCVLVGCCYMRLTAEEPPFEDCLTTEDHVISNNGHTKPVGYPLSDYVKRKSCHRQCYNGLEAACHALLCYRKKLLG